MLTVIENLFVADCAPGHEVVFLFLAELADPALYRRDVFDATDDGEPLRMIWRSLNDGSAPLYPDGLRELLA